jgi:hypothetical protein
VIGSTRPSHVNSPYIHHIDEIKTDDFGRFVFDRVPAGNAGLNRAWPTEDGGWTSLDATGTSVAVASAGTVRVTLGGAGRPVLGRFELSSEVPNVDWSKVRARIAPVAPHIGLPSDEALWAAYRSFLASMPADSVYRDNIPIAPDGSFRVEALPQGKYLLIAWIQGPAIGKPDDPSKVYAAGSLTFEVAPMPDGTSDIPLDLGRIQVRVQK